jgi:uncharacterized protein YybS (DUF2232 family)
VQKEVEVGLIALVAAVAFRTLRPMSSDIEFDMGDRSWNLNQVAFWILVLIGVGVLLWALAGLIGPR